MQGKLTFGIDMIELKPDQDRSQKKFFHVDEVCKNVVLYVVKYVRGKQKS